MMPSGWKESKIGDLFKKRSSSGLDSLPTASVTTGRGLVLRENLDRKMETTLKAHQHLLVRKGDIAYNMMRMWQGALGLADFDCIVSPAYVVCEPKDANVYSRFFYYLFKSSVLIKKFKDSSRGLTEDRLRLYYDDFEKIKVRVPSSLQEQKRIATILSTWDDAIAQNSKLVFLKEKYKADLASKIMSGEHRLQGYSKPWTKKKLKDLGCCVRGLTYSPKNIVSDGLLVLRSSNILNGRIALEDNVYVDIDVPATYQSKPGDILICVRNGSRNLIGKTALIPRNLPKATHGAFMTVFRTNYSAYVFQLFQTELYYGQVAKNLGATINSINNSDLLEFSFSIPSDEKEIQEIAAIFESFDREISVLREIGFSYQKQKQGLMQQLLAGKKRVKV